MHEDKLKKRTSGGDRERSQAAARAVAGARDDGTTAAAERSGTSTGSKGRRKGVKRDLKFCANAGCI